MPFALSTAPGVPISIDEISSIFKFTSFKALIQVLNILLTIFSGESGSNVGVICLDIILLSSTIPTAIFFHLNLYRFYTFLFLTVNHCNIRVQLKYGSRNFRCYRSRKCLFKYFFLSFAIFIKTLCGKINHVNYYEGIMSNGSGSFNLLDDVLNGGDINKKVGEYKPEYEKQVEEINAFLE